MDINQLAAALIPIVRDVIGGMLLMSDSGVMGEAREAGAIATYMRESINTFGGNPIIELIVEGMLEEDGRLPLPDSSTVDVANLFNNVGSAANALNSIEGGVQVKQFIYGLAQHIAGASGAGLFGRGQKVNAGEQQVLDGLKAVLGV